MAGGASTSWRSFAPSGTSPGKYGDDDIRSHITSIGDALDGEHYWDKDAVTTERGRHRQGSARAYLDAESNLSGSGVSESGKLYITSDTSRVFYTPDSGITGFVSPGPKTPEVFGYSAAITPGVTPDPDYAVAYHAQNVRNVIEVGYSTGDSVISYANLYETPPRIICTSQDSDSFGVNISVFSNRGFIPITYYSSSGATGSQCELFWMSVGTLPF